MSRDRLYLLEVGFEDPKTPGPLWFCPHSNRVEGLLATWPGLAERIDVVRVPFPRPRAEVIAVLGEESQGLPALVLADEPPPPEDAKRHGEIRFVADTDRILALLAERHGAPRSR